MLAITTSSPKPADAEKFISNIVRIFWGFLKPLVNCITSSNRNFPSLLGSVKSNPACIARFKLASTIKNVNAGIFPKGLKSISGVLISIPAEASKCISKNRSSPLGAVI